MIWKPSLNYPVPRAQGVLEVFLESINDLISEEVKKIF